MDGVPGRAAQLRRGHVCVLACDGLKGLPEAVAEIWPLATVQLCVVHLVRASLRYASLVIRTPRPNRANVTGKTTGWKKALNALAMYYGERITKN